MLPPRLWVGYLVKWDFDILQLQALPCMEHGKMLPKNKNVQAGINKERQERRYRLGCCGMEDSSLEDRERGEPEGEEGGAGRYCTCTDNNTDEEEKEEKEAGNKKRRGGERTRETGEKDGGREEVRGGKEKASRKGDRGEEERPANGDCDSNTEKGERGMEGRKRRENGQCTAQKWKGRVHQAMSEQEEHEGLKRGATGEGPK
jgi:hypothetical protein